MRKQKKPGLPGVFLHLAIGSVKHDRCVIFATGMIEKNTGRGERIRTSDFYLPKVALYQAELHPDSESKASRAF